MPDKSAASPDSSQYRAHLESMLSTAMDALKYIAAPPERTKIIQLGKRSPAPDKQPHVTAQQALGILRGMWKHAVKVMPPVGGISDQDGKQEQQQVEAASGDSYTIPDKTGFLISTEYDGFVHECCDCGLKHKVTFQWAPDGSREVMTIWERLAKGEGLDTILAQEGVESVQPDVAGITERVMTDAKQKQAEQLIDDMQEMADKMPDIDSDDRRAGEWNYAEAVKYVKSGKPISVAAIQRHVRLGYVDAKTALDRMLLENIVIEIHKRRQGEDRYILNPNSGSNES